MKPSIETAPEHFGPYEVYERLGLGGMASVHRAKKRGPEGFERSVALKRMLSHLAEDPSFVESFVREAKVASLLQHPNIAQVYDFGRISGTYYIAMELVAGFDVRKLLRYANRANEAIPLPVVLSILGELCDALDYAHTFVDEAGQPLHIVHRDVSPSNLIIAHTGHLKVIDFGIAKANSRQLHTESGQVKGKLGYMAPEVALGMNVGPVSDLFSLGVVAWELVTASPLFSARSDFETMRKIREEPIAPPSRLNPTCPPKLDRVILAALEREPEARVASARQVRKVLDEVAAETASHVSARGVAEWMLKFVQPEDSWGRAATVAASEVTSIGLRARTASEQRNFLPPEPPTAVVGRARTSTPLHRTPEEVQLAREIWGEDATSNIDAAAQPDFHIQVATPPPLTGALEVRPALTTAPRPSPIPSVLAAPIAPEAITLRGKRASTMPPVAYTIPPAPPTRRRAVIIVALLAVGAGAFAATLFAKRRDSKSPAIAEAPQAPQLVVDPAEPAIDQPDTVKPDTDKPDTDELDTDEPDSDKPERAPPRHGSKPASKREPKRTAKPDKQVAEARKPEPKLEPKSESKPEPKLDVQKPEPPTPEPPPVEPAKPEPDKPVDLRPARTPVVAASAVTKLSGEVPQLRARNAEAGSDVLAKMCIDDRGRVASVKIVKANPEIASELQGALGSWRYKPYTKDGKPTPVCFPLSLRVVVKSS